MENKICQEKLLEQLDAIKTQLMSSPLDSTLTKEAENIIETIISTTRNSYNNTAKEYKELRWFDQPHDDDIHHFNELTKLARDLLEQKKIGQDGIIYLLDVGTGSGRDLRYFRQFPDINAIGIDNSESFIKILEESARNGEIEPGSFYNMDMRYLKFADETFDVVRHNATLLHIPLIGPGLGVDQVLKECNRVLRNNGILFINVKYGEGTEFVDTKEGLGARFFQFFTEDTLANALRRNGFTILSTETWLEHRSTGDIKWMAVYSQK